MSDQYAALRAAAERTEGAHDRLSVMPPDDIFDISLQQGTQLDNDITDLNNFNDAANPATILELLAERDADKARIAELESRKVKLDHPKIGKLHGALIHVWPAYDVQTAIAFAGISLKIEGE